MVGGNEAMEWGKCEIWYTDHVHTYIVYMSCTHLIVDNFFYYTA